MIPARLGFLLRVLQVFNGQQQILVPPLQQIDDLILFFQLPLKILLLRALVTQLPSYLANLLIFDS